MRIYYMAFGFYPRSQTENTGRNELCSWARNIGPQGFQGRSNTRRAHWDEPYTSSDRSTTYTDSYELLPFMKMGSSVLSTGWVMTRHRTGHSRFEEIDVWYIDVIRCLPEIDAQMRLWGNRRTGARQWQIIRGYNRQYNQTLRTRLMSHLVPSEAHRQSVRDMHRQAVNLIFEFAMELASAANVPTGTLLRGR